MKRGLLVIGVVFLLSLVVFVGAQDVDPDAPVDPGDGSSGVRGVSNDLLNKEIEIPEGLQLAARAIFGIKQGTAIDLQTLVILVALWLILLILIKNIFEIFPMFGEGLRAWFGSFLVTLLIAFSGGILLAASLVLDFSRFFGLLEEWGMVTLFIGLVALAVLYYLFSKFIKFMKMKRQVEGAEKTGMEIALERLFAKKTREYSEYGRSVS